MRRRRMLISSLIFLCILAVADLRYGSVPLRVWILALLTCFVLVWIAERRDERDMLD